MPRKLPLITAPLLAAALTTPMHGAVLTNLGTVSTIDPLNEVQDVDLAAVGSTPEATLEARSDLRVIADFRQGSEVAAQGTNIAAFDDTDLPDILFEFISGERSTAGNQTSQSSQTTSDGEGMRFLGANGRNDIVYEINFGTYGVGPDLAEGGGDDTFDTTAVGVEAAGFTLSDILLGFTVTAEFFAIDDTTSLGSQTVVGALDGTSTSDGIDGYFGLESVANPIGLIRVTRANTLTTGTSQSYDSGVDDVAFSTAVPEPASLALLAAGGLCLLPRRRR
jgi:hypothetical protein